MSEHMSAEIWIGGPIPAALVPELCAEIGGEVAALDWGEVSFSPDTAAELLAALRNDLGVPLLHLHDDQARWGQFEGLETFLQKHGIPFRRRSEGKWEYDPELIEFRPNVGMVRYMTNNTGEPVVCIRELQTVELSVAKAVKLLGGGSAAKALTKMRGALRQLREQFLPAVGAV